MQAMITISDQLNGLESTVKKPLPKNAVDMLERAGGYSPTVFNKYPRNEYDYNVSVDTGIDLMKQAQALSYKARKQFVQEAKNNGTYQPVTAIFKESIVTTAINNPSVKTTTLTKQLAEEQGSINPDALSKKVLRSQIGKATLNTAHNLMQDRSQSSGSHFKDTKPTASSSVSNTVNKIRSAITNADKFDAQQKQITMLIGMVAGGKEAQKQLVLTELSNGMSVTKASKLFGIHRNTVMNWRKD